MGQQAAVGVGEVCKLLGVSPATLHRMRKKPGFPVPLAIHGRPRWARETIDAFLQRLNSIDRRDIALESFLANFPAARDMPEPDQLAAALTWYRAWETNAAQRGAAKSASVARWALAALGGTA